MSPELELAIRQALGDSGRYSTHWDGCAADHPWCAVRVVLEALDAERAEVTRLRAGVADAECA